MWDQRSIQARYVRAFESQRPYVVTGITVRGRKVRKSAPYNTAKEQARRVRQMQRVYMDFVLETGFQKYES